MKKLLTFLSLLFIAACQPDAEAINVVSDDAERELVKIIIEIDKSPSSTPAQLSLEVGESINLTAIAYYDDDSQEDVTGDVRWHSTNNTLTQFSDNSLVALAEGKVNIRALLNDFESEPLSISITAKPSAQVNNSSTQATSQTTAVNRTQSNALSTQQTSEAVLTKINIEFVSLRDMNDQNQYEIIIGNNVALEATAIYSDNSTKDITREVHWSSSNAIVGIVSNAIFINVETGITNITADLNGIISNELVVAVVEKPVLTDINISFAHIQSANTKGEYEFTVGDNLNLQAIATYSDKTTKDITSEVTWKSSKKSVSTISTNTLAAIAKGTSHITATFDGIRSNQLTVSVIPKVVLTAINIEFVPEQTAKSNDQYELTIGDKLTLKATGTYSDKTTKDITKEVSWMSSNVSVGTISSNTLAGITEGSVNITAVVNEVVSNQLVVSVVPKVTLTDIKIELVPTQSGTNSGQYELTIGDEVTVKATGYYSNNTNKDITSEVNWRSSNGAVTKITNHTLQGIAKGVTNINAEFNKVTSNEIVVAVTPKVTLSDIKIEWIPTQTVSTNDQYELTIGDKLTFKATGYYSDNSSKDITNEVSWRSSNAVIGKMTSNTLEGVARGVINITAVFDKVTSNNLVVSVIPKVTLTEIKVEFIPVPTMHTNGQYEFTVGDRFTLKATGYYSDNTTKDITSVVSWRSSNSSIGAITSNTLEGLAEGVTNISAVFNKVTSNNLVVSVVPKVILTDIKIELLPAQVVGTNGQYEFIVGDRFTLKATGHYSDNTNKDLTSVVSWRSSNDVVGKITSNTLESMTKGVTNITAVFNKITSNNLVVSVMPKVTLTEIKIEWIPAQTPIANGQYELTIGDKFTLKATGLYSDSTSKDVTSEVNWLSSNGTIGQITGNTLEGVAKGVTQITATVDNIRSNQLVVSVIPKVTLSDIKVEWITEQTVSANGQYELTVGDKLTLKATGHYSDNTNKDITSMVKWRSSNDAISKLMSNTLEGIAEGEINVTATLENITSNELLISVIPKVVLTDINIEFVSAPTTNANGQYELNLANPDNRFTLKAMATYSDNTSKDVTNEVSWESSNASVGTVSTSILTGVADGITNITATLDNVTSNQLEVSVFHEVVLTKIDLRLLPTQTTNANGEYEINLGRLYGLRATGIYNDNSTKDITAEVNWESSDAIVGLVVYATFEGMAEGVTDITATLGDVTSDELVLSVVSQ